MILSLPFHECGTCIFISSFVCVCSSIIFMEIAETSRSHPSSTPSPPLPRESEAQLEPGWGQEEASGALITEVILAKALGLRDLPPSLKICQSQYCHRHYPVGMWGALRGDELKEEAAMPGRCPKTSEATESPTPQPIARMGRARPQINFFTEMPLKMISRQTLFSFPWEGASKGPGTAHTLPAPPPNACA